MPLEPSPTVAQRIEALQAHVGALLATPCRRRHCSYYERYLRFGHAELGHGRYHALERQAREAQTLDHEHFLAHGPGCRCPHGSSLRGRYLDYVRRMRW